MDPFAVHRQHMSAMFGGFGSPLGFDPFLSITDGRSPTPQLPGPLQHNRRMLQQSAAVSPFGIFGMGRGGFADMFGMMNSMFSNINSLIDNVDQMGNPSNCQTYSSSTVVSYSNMGNGAPKVYQSTSETRSAPGGIRETRRSMRDSESGLEKVAIGHHIGERGHILERSMNRRTGDREQRQDFINLEESEADAFDDEWRRETSRFGTARSINYRRERGVPAQPVRQAIAYQESGGPQARQSRRYDW